jgi:hypothetical protein
MTKNIVQLYVENLLKVLKALKTRTALTMNELSEFRLRYTRKGAKAPFKTKEQNRITKLLQNAKNIERTLDKW